MRLFISYARVDKPIVQTWIVNTLLSGGHEVWFDDRLTGGEDWRVQLEREILRSDVLVYCMTPEAVQSEWCRWELGVAMTAGKRILPVLLQARTPIPSDLSAVQVVDFSAGVTGDAVARLMGGLQALRGASPESVTSPAASGAPLPMKPHHHVLKILAHPATQGAIGVIGVILAVLALMGGGNTPPTPTAPPTLTPMMTATPDATHTLTPSETPSTPLVTALVNLDIRVGAGVDTAKIGTLSAGNSLDVLAVSEDGRWYQVLMVDGREGWLPASTSGVRLSGNRDVLPVLLLTATPTLTPTATITPSLTPTDTHTSTATPTVTASPTFTSTPTPLPPSLTPSRTVNVPPPSETPVVTRTPRASVTPTGVYPCEAVIDPNSASTVIRVRRDPNPNSAFVETIRRGTTVIITNRNADYYEIQSNNRTLGWVDVRTVIPSDACP